MDRVRFAIGWVIVLVGLTVPLSAQLNRPVITNQALAAFISVILIILGAITVYDAAHRTKPRKDALEREVA